MSEDKNPQVPNDQNGDQKDFDKRLQRARDLSAGVNQGGKTGLPESGKGKAMRIGTELIVAIAVGGGIGFLIDTWLETKPWFFIGFLFLGNAAGLWNIFRLTNGQGYKVGFDRDKQSETKETE
jgi:ATP synthase protein I